MEEGELNKIAGENMDTAGFSKNYNNAGHFTNLTPSSNDTESLIFHSLPETITDETFNVLEQQNANIKEEITPTASTCSWEVSEPQQMPQELKYIKTENGSLKCLRCKCIIIDGENFEDHVKICDKLNDFSSHLEYDMKPLDLDFDMKEDTDNLAEENDENESEDNNIVKVYKCYCEQVFLGRIDYLDHKLLCQVEPMTDQALNTDMKPKLSDPEVTDSNAIQTLPVKESTTQSSISITSIYQKLNRLTGFPMLCDITGQNFDAARDLDRQSASCDKDNEVKHDNVDLPGDGGDSSDTDDYELPESLDISRNGSGAVEIMESSLNEDEVQARFKCTLCDIECPTEELFCNHMASKHIEIVDENKDLGTSTLKEETTYEASQGNLSKQIHEDEKGSSNDESVSEEDQDNVKIKDKNKIKCFFRRCKRTFRSEKSFREHLNKELYTQNRKQRKNIRYGLSASEIQTKLRDLDMTEVIYSCNYPGCGYMFLTLNWVKWHCMAFHPSTDLICPKKDCPKRFKSKNDLKSHIIVDHAVKCTEAILTAKLKKLAESVCHERKRVTRKKTGNVGKQTVAYKKPDSFKNGKKGSQGKEENVGSRGATKTLKQLNEMDGEKLQVKTAEATNVDVTNDSSATDSDDNIPDVSDHGSASIDFEIKTRYETKNSKVCLGNLHDCVYRCKYCEKGFLTALKLKLHCQCKHGSAIAQANYMCSSCSRSFKSDSERFVHVCGAGADTRNAMLDTDGKMRNDDLGEKTSLSEREDRKKCGRVVQENAELEVIEIPKEGSRNATNEMNRDAKHNQQEESGTVTPEIGASSETEQVNLSSCTKKVHRSSIEEDVFICDHPGCNFKCVTLDEWKQHSSNGHAKVDFICERKGCFKSFKSKNELKSHIIVDHAVMSRVPIFTPMLRRAMVAVIDSKKKQSLKSADDSNSDKDPSEPNDETRTSTAACETKNSAETESISRKRIGEEINEDLEKPSKVLRADEAEDDDITNKGNENNSGIPEVSGSSSDVNGSKIRSPNCNMEGQRFIERLYDGLLRCMYCKEAFSTANLLKLHCQLKHASASTKHGYHCSTCGKTFHSEAEKSDHNCGEKVCQENTTSNTDCEITNDSAIENTWRIDMKSHIIVDHSVISKVPIFTPMLRKAVEAVIDYKKKQSLKSTDDSNSDKDPSGPNDETRTSTAACETKNPAETESISRKRKGEEINEGLEKPSKVSRADEAEDDDITNKGNENNGGIPEVSGSSSDGNGSKISSPNRSMEGQRFIERLYDGLLRCMYCEEAFSTANLLKLHCQLKHASASTKHGYHCSTCGKKFHSEAEKSDHNCGEKVCQENTTSDTDCKVTNDSAIGNARRIDSKERNVCSSIMQDNDKPEALEIDDSEDTPMNVNGGAKYTGPEPVVPEVEVSKGVTEDTERGPIHTEPELEVLVVEEENKNVTKEMEPEPKHAGPEKEVLGIEGSIENVTKDTKQDAKHTGLGSEQGTTSEIDQNNPNLQVMIGGNNSTANHKLFGCNYPGCSKIFVTLNETVQHFINCHSSSSHICDRKGCGKCLKSKKPEPEPEVLVVEEVNKNVTKEMEPEAKHAGPELEVLGIEGSIGNVTRDTKQDAKHTGLGSEQGMTSEIDKNNPNLQVMIWGNNSTANHKLFGCNYPGCSKIFVTLNETVQHFINCHSSSSHICDRKGCGKCLKSKKPEPEPEVLVVEEVNKNVTKEMEPEAKHAGPELEVLGIEGSIGNVTKDTKQDAKHTGLGSEQGTTSEIDQNNLNLQVMIGGNNSATSNKRFGCNYPGCSKIFVTLNETVQHFINCHSCSSHICDRKGCGKSFKSKKELKSHISVDHSINSRAPALVQMLGKPVEIVYKERQRLKNMFNPLLHEHP